eukprot:Gb_11881 [translate_table: standard]
MARCCAKALQSLFTLQLSVHINFSTMWPMAISIDFIQEVEKNNFVTTLTVIVGNITRVCWNSKRGFPFGGEKEKKASTTFGERRWRRPSATEVKDSSPIRPSSSLRFKLKFLL